MNEFAEIAWLKEKLPSGLVPKNASLFEISVNASQNAEILLDVSDTILHGEIFCKVEKVVLKRKNGSFPKDEFDGETVFVLNRENLHDYSVSPFVDETVQENRSYCYQVFIISEGNSVNRSFDNRRKIIIGEVPPAMSKFYASKAPGNNVYLYLDIPESEIINGDQVFVDSVTIRRKEGSYPKDETDGEIVLRLEKEYLHAYKYEPFIDSTRKLGEFFYRAFPATENGILNFDFDKNSTKTKTGAIPEAATFSAIPNSDGTISLKVDVNDSILNADGEEIGHIKKLTVVRKQEGFPENIEDGIQVFSLSKENIHEYSENFFIDTLDFSAIFYYTVFVESSDGIINADTKKKVLMEETPVFGFRIDKEDPNPRTRVEYIGINEGFAPMQVNMLTGDMNYGSWKDSSILNAFRPVMLKYDGTVDYELDHDNQKKKLDGTDSDVSNRYYGGNAMVECRKIYMKCWENERYEFCEFSFEKIDDDFHAFAHQVDGGETELDFIYLPMFEGSRIDGKLRSIGGVKPLVNVNAELEQALAKGNGDGWQTNDFSNFKLIENLLILLGRSTDTQAVFGNGLSSFGTSVASISQTGMLSSDGMFFGSVSDAVKVFWMENWYGNRSDRIIGCMTDENGNVLIQPCKPYTMDISDGNWVLIAMDGQSLNGYQNSHEMTRFGLIPKSDKGSNSTYIPDRILLSPSCQACIGGNSQSDISNAGASYLNLSAKSSDKHWTIGASLSFKKKLDS